MSEETTPNTIKIEVAQADLKEALQVAVTTVSNQSDITSHFVFTLAGQDLFVLSSNLPRTFSKTPVFNATVTYEDDAPESGRFTVDAKSILQALSVTTGLVTMTYDGQGSVSFSNDKGSLYFNSLDPASFPNWEGKIAKAQANTVTVPADVLAESLASVKPCVSTNEVKKQELTVVAFVNGIAYACDSYVMGMARHDSLRGVNGVMIHYKDIGAMIKYLKAHSGQDVEILKSSDATFLKLENDAIYGFMDLPYTYPSVITTRYLSTFDLIPNRVWTFNKNEITTALGFMGAGSDADDTDCTLTDPVGALASSPTLSTKSSRTNKTVNYTISASEPEIILPEGVELKDYDYSAIPHLGIRMATAHKVLTSKGEVTPSLDSFKFNSNMIKRIVDTFNDEVYMGSEVEDNNNQRGYCVFKNTTNNGVDVTTILGWVK